MWLEEDLEKSLKYWVAIFRGLLPNESSWGLGHFLPKLLDKSSEKPLREQIVEMLDDLIDISVESTIELLSQIEVDEIVILKKIKKSKEMKIRYLELLASKGRKKKFIYEELVKEYLNGKKTQKFFSFM